MNDFDKEKELVNCSHVKVVLMLLVILYHSLAFWKQGWFAHDPQDKSDILKYIAVWLNSFHIYGFTLISGYVFYAMKYERGKYQNYLSFIANKVKRLVLPLIFVTVIWVLPIYILFFKPSLNVIVHKFVLIESPSQLWFLGMLFVVFLLFYPIASISKKSNVIGGALVIIAYGLSIIGSRFMPNVFQIWSGMRYMLFFYIGFCIRKSDCNLLYRISSIVYILLDVVLFVASIYLESKTGVFRLFSIACDLSLNIVGAVGSFVIIQRMFNKKSPANRTWNFLKSNNMIIYLLHQQIIYIVIATLDSHVNMYLLAAINFLSAIILSAIMAWLFGKFSATRFLLTGKK